MSSPAALEAFLAANPDAIACELASVRGSSPREAGTTMVVGLAGIFGTIGGGALEYMVIDHARRLIAQGLAEAAMDVPLGPEIGQCCGGRVAVQLRHVDRSLRDELVARLRAETAALPHVYVFGAGHVGRVLAEILALMPVRLEVIDTRSEELEMLPAGIAHRRVAMPEAVVRAAPMGSSFVILTHDHALDFLIAGEALRRMDSPMWAWSGRARSGRNSPVGSSKTGATRGHWSGWSCRSGRRGLGINGRPLSRHWRRRK